MRHYGRMRITIELKCPQCSSSKIVRNGKKSNGPQNYLGKDRGHQFIWDSFLINLYR
jgi:transposase-like protein